MNLLLVLLCIALFCVLCSLIWQDNHMNYTAKVVLIVCSLIVFVMFLKKYAFVGAELGGKEVDTQKIEDVARSMDETATQEPETEDEIHYTVYVYNKDGTIKKSYNDVFDVAVLHNGAVQISMDKEGKETRLLVNEPVEIVQDRVTTIIPKTQQDKENKAETEKR